MVCQKKFRIDNPNTSHRVSLHLSKSAKVSSLTFQSVCAQQGKKQPQANTSSQTANQTRPNVQSSSTDPHKSEQGRQVCIKKPTKSHSNQKLHKNCKSPPMGTCGRKLDLTHLVAKKTHLTLAITTTTFKYAKYSRKSTGDAKRCHHAP